MTVAPVSSTTTGVQPFQPFKSMVWKDLIGPVRSVWPAAKGLSTALRIG